MNFIISGIFFALAYWYFKEFEFDLDNFWQVDGDIFFKIYAVISIICGVLILGGVWEVTR